jgi:hypothetical protein
MTEVPNHHMYTWVSHDGGVPVMTFDWIGSEGDTAYDPVNDLVLTSYDDAFTATMAAASNESDLLTADNCQFGCTMARRVAMSGTLVISDGVKLSDYRWASQPG